MAAARSDVLISRVEGTAPYTYFHVDCRNCETWDLATLRAYFAATYDCSVTVGRGSHGIALYNSKMDPPQKGAHRIDALATSGFNFSTCGLVPSLFDATIVDFVATNMNVKETPCFGWSHDRKATFDLISHHAALTCFTIDFRKKTVVALSPFMAALGDFRIDNVYHVIIDAPKESFTVRAGSFIASRVDVSIFNKSICGREQRCIYGYTDGSVVCKQSERFLIPGTTRVAREGRGAKLLSDDSMNGLYFIYRTDKAPPPSTLQLWEQLQPPTSKYYMFQSCTPRVIFETIIAGDCLVNACVTFMQLPFAAAAEDAALDIGLDNGLCTFGVLHVNFDKQTTLVLSVNEIPAKSTGLAHAPMIPCDDDTGSKPTSVPVPIPRPAPKSKGVVVAPMIPCDDDTGSTKPVSTPAPKSSARSGELTAEALRRTTDEALKNRLAADNIVSIILAPAARAGKSEEDINSSTEGAIIDILRERGFNVQSHGERLVVSWAI